MLQAAEIENKTTPNSSAINFVNRRRRTNTHASANQPKKLQNQKCTKCGGKWPHKNKTCPAIGQVCRKCGKENHFAKQCRTKSVFQGQGQNKTQQKKNIRPVDVESEENN